MNALEYQHGLAAASADLDNRLRPPQTVIEVAKTIVNTRAIDRKTATQASEFQKLDEVSGQSKINNSYFAPPKSKTETPAQRISGMMAGGAA